MLINAFFLQDKAAQLTLGTRLEEDSPEVHIWLCLHAPETSKKRNSFTRFAVGSPHFLKASYLRDCGVKSATASLLAPEDRMAIRSTHTEG